jgi:hypothetical protein
MTVYPNANVAGVNHNVVDSINIITTMMRVILGTEKDSFNLSGSSYSARII